MSIPKEMLYGVRSEIPNVITPEVLVQQYKLASEGFSSFGYPKLNDSNDPDQNLRCAIGAWELHLVLDGIAWVEGKRFDEADSNDVYTIDWEGHPMNKKIPVFKNHALIDLHFNYLNAAKGKVDDELWEDVDNTLQASAEDGGGDIIM